MPTLQELLEMERNGKKPRKPSRNLEHQLQCSEVSYFRAQYPKLSRLFFAVPNGQKRTEAQTTWLHNEGMVNGVADMILLLPNKGFHCLCIENKTKTGRQTPDQKLFQRAIEDQGGKYVIVRSIEQFVKVIKEYLK